MARPKSTFTRPDLTAELLRELYDYDPSTGIFRRARPFPYARSKGEIAGGVNAQGYVQLRIHGVFFQAHRLAWLYVHGHMPENEVDHIDGNRTNNAISNLRHVSRKQNQENLHGRKNNKSGHRGVHLVGNKWVARVGHMGGKIYLGAFTNIEDAAKAAREGRARVHTHSQECTVTA